MWFRVIFTVFCVLVGGAPLSASPAPARSASASVILMARPEGKAEALKMAQVLRYQLRGSGAVLTLRWVAPGATELAKAAHRIAITEHPLLVVWDGAVDKNQIHIYFPRPGAAKGRIRTVAKAAESRSGRIEVAGLIVRSSVEAILSNRAPKRPRSRPVAPKVVVRKPAPPPKRRISLAVALQYGLSAYSPDTGQNISHAGALEVHLTFKRSWSVFLGYGFVPLVARYTDVVLTQQRHGLVVGGAYTWRWGRTSISARLSVETDIIRSDTEISFEADHAPFLDVNVGVSTGLRLNIALTSRLGVHTGVGAVFTLLNSEYSAGSLLLSKPWTVRPLWFVGMNARFY